MAGAWTARRWELGLTLSFALAGCVTLPSTPNSPAPEAGRALARPRPDAEIPRAPDLRIPSDAVAAAPPEIPLVPVPPPPLAGDRQPRPPAGPVRQASAQVPDSSTPPPVSTRPGSPSSPETTRHSARELVRLAAQRYAGIDSYIVRMTRREQVNGKNGPEEIILFKFRKEPWSLHFKWLGTAAHGREVVYVKGHYENKIHTLLAAGDSLLMPAGKRISLGVDSPLVRSASRHPITEAGIGAVLEHLEAYLDAQERGDRSHGILNNLGPQTRVEYPRPVETLEHVIPPGLEPEFPRGGRRLYFFDPLWNFPLLVIGQDERGQEVEYYRYDRLQAPVHLDADDFNPDKLWAPPPKRPAGPAGRNTATGS